MSVAGSIKDGFTQEVVSVPASSPHIYRQGKIELYVGGVNEQGYLCFYASANINNRNRDLVNGSIQITRIDFLN